jgi:hypothetical protein
VCKQWKQIVIRDFLWERLLLQDFPYAFFENPKFTAKQKYALAHQKYVYVPPKRSLKQSIMGAFAVTRAFQELRMFHPSNGRNNFLPFTPSVPFEEMPDKETLMKMMRREDELRLSKEIQDEYWAKGDFFGTTLRVQLQAVEEYGFSNPWIIPSALTYYSEDPDITSIPHYVRFNRSKQGKLECGDSIPDIPLSTTKGCGTSLHTLLAPYQGIPIVVAAGSYTWPPFNDIIPQLTEIYEKFNSKVGFLTVYISEAHAQDEWPIGDDVLVSSQPKEISERCQVAREFQADRGYNLPLVVDTMDNQFDEFFGAWPARFFIILNNILVFKAQPNSDHMYNLAEVHDWLVDHTSN